MEIYEHKQRIVVPKKDEMLDIIVELFPYQTHDKIKVLDVGAGKGALTEKILHKFPRSSVTCLDSSQEMLRDARYRFSRNEDRVSYIQADFNDPDWNSFSNDEFEVIASSVALQYLKSECRKRFFRQCYLMTRDGGCIINGTAFKSEDPGIQKIYEDFKARYIQNQLRKLDGEELTIDEIIIRRKDNRERAGVNFYTVDEQIALLKESGFQRVDCVWNYYNMAIVIGLKLHQK